MKRYYNESADRWYVEGKTLTFCHNGKLFMGSPTEEQLHEFGFVEYVAPVEEQNPSDENNDLPTLADVERLSEYPLWSEIEQRFQQLENKSANSGIKILSKTIDNINIAGNGRKNVVIDLELPDGYVIGSFREISIANATDSGANFEKTSLQLFGTTGGGLKCNISVINHGVSEAKIKIIVTVLAIKKDMI